MTVQLELPFLNDRDTRPALPRAVVEVVLAGDKPRVRPLNHAGWVRFPRKLRIPGIRYRVELLKPAPGGAWIATGRIRRLPGGVTLPPTSLKPA